MNDKKQFEEGPREETTENEFSELSDGNKQKEQELRFRGTKQEFKDDITKSPTKKQKKLPELQRNVPFTLKQNNFAIRAIWTIIMLLGFILFICAGHFYLTLLIIWLNVAIFNEILSLKRNYEKELKFPHFFKLNWYFFSVGVFFFYGKLFTNKLTKYTLSNKYVVYVINYHNFISFMLWVGGFLMFVLFLKKGYYRYQFRLFGWTHIALFLVVAQISVITMNAYEGLVWFIYPCLLVITNDILAYLFGKPFGRKIFKFSLIELSPNKSWEGFIGGLVSTIVMAAIFASYFQEIDYLVCPKLDLTFVPFESLSCTKSPIFIQKSYTVPLIGGNFSFSEFQMHGIVISLFISLIAPFGGFFASGFKRALKIKDFGDTIPGHGGVTDRMDCQILTGMFCYVYLHQIILSQMTTAHSITNFILSMPTEDQLLIYNELTQILTQKQLI